MVRLLSFTLYGADRLYCHGAIRNAELAPEVYPGWCVRFAVDDTVPVDVRDRLRALGADVVPMTKSLGPEYPKFRRFLVAADPAVERFACRDADSRLNVREKAAVDEWIASGVPFHAMRDSVHHDRRMMGGMWGGMGGLLPDIAARIDAWGRFERWGDSDLFMSEIVWPLVRDRLLVHDSVGHFGDGRPFPSHPPLTGTCYVGEIVPVDRPPLDTWREIGVLRDRVATLHAELARRDAENVAAQAEIARQLEARRMVEAEVAQARSPKGTRTREPAPANRSLLRRVLAGFERRVRSTEE
jgi:hypothetical protein